jgi:branched-chain amino acid transport system substrate-binding protein
MAGPDYTEMLSILLEYIAEENPGASVAFVHSDTEFGRDPFPTAQQRAEELGLTVAETIVTPPGSVDVSTEVLKLRRSRPDYAIFHGYVLAPIPEFISQARQMGLDTRFMGTFWSMDNSTVMSMGEAAEGFMGVMPYRYYYDTEGEAPMLDTIREMRPEYQSTAYMQGFLTAMLMTEAVKRTLEEGKELSGENLKAALNSLEDFDTGGIIGVPISIPGNSIPVGRIYRADTAAQKMVPVSDWIQLDADAS